MFPANRTGRPELNSLQWYSLADAERLSVIFLSATVTGRQFTADFNVGQIQAYF